MAAALREHAGDVWGLALLALGLIAALGIYADLTGPAGRGMRTLTGSLVGLGRLLLPPALCWMGAILLWDRRHEDPGRLAATLEAIAAATGFGFRKGDPARFAAGGKS